MNINSYFRHLGRPASEADTIEPLELDTEQDIDLLPNETLEDFLERTEPQAKELP